MTTAEPSPCRCDAPNPECRRAGAPMVGRLWELCQTSKAYRQLWDGVDWDSLESSAPPAYGVGRLRTCLHRGRALKGEDGRPRYRVPP